MSAWRGAAFACCIWAHLFSCWVRNVSNGFSTGGSREWLPALSPGCAIPRGNTHHQLKSWASVERWVTRGSRLFTVRRNVPSPVTKKGRSSYNRRKRLPSKRPPSPAIRRLPVHSTTHGPEWRHSLSTPVVWEHRDVLRCRRRSRRLLWPQPKWR